MNKLETAIRLAVEAHAGLKDKAGASYILHPLRVMMQMDNETEMIAAVLHDAVEDSKFTIEDLVQYNFPAESLNALLLLTKKGKVNYDEYISGIKRNPIAVKIKIADLEDNLRVVRLNSIDDDDITRIKKYHNAYKILKGII